jgi:hypothetical protein
MVAKRTLRVLHLCLLLTLAASYLVAQESQPTSNPGSVRAAKPRDGLLDFALKRINPSDVDYGQCVDEGRKLILEQTISRGYFWSNLAALGLVGVFFLVIVHQQRLHYRRELIASESLTQYHNALARADAQAMEATRRNHALMETLTALSESRVTGEPAESSMSKDALGKERKRVGNSGENGKAVPLAPVVAAARGEFRKSGIALSSVAKNRETAASKESQAKDQIALFGDDANLTAKINSLQQQLDALNEEKKQLIRQVSFADLRLQKEQQKNRSLKGE